MAYTKQGFKDGDPLFAKQLENMEDGILDLEKHVEGLEELTSDFNQDIAALYKTQNYIFTGSYTNVQGQYQVALDDNYSWDNLVSAVRGGRYVVCVLFDEDKLLPLTFTAGEVFVEDGYVNLHSDGEGTVRRELYIYENGDLELYETSLATRGEIARKLDAYTFTGRFSQIDSTFEVTLNDDYSWNKLVAAVTNQHYVQCKLFDEDDFPIDFTLGADVINEAAEVILLAVVSPEIIYTLIISDDGSVDMESTVLVSERSLSAKLDNKLDTYIFTGEYTYNDDDTYTVAFDDNYSWDKLLTAVNENKDVRCALIDEVGEYKILLAFCRDSFIPDGYVTLSSTDEGGNVWQLDISQSYQRLSFYVIARQSELTDKLAAYAFYGNYTESDDNGYNVTFNSSYDWAYLKNAALSGKYVVCALSNDAGNKIVMTLTESMLGDDDYVVFTSPVEATGRYSLYIHSDGSVDLFWVALATQEYVNNAIENSTPDIVAEVLATLPTWEGGSY